MGCTALNGNLLKLASLLMLYSILDLDMKKQLLFIFALCSATVFSQNRDFEQTGYEIKAVAMNTEARSLLALNLEEDELPTRFTLGPLFRDRNPQQHIPLIFKTVEAISAKNPVRADFTIKAPSLKAKEIYAFGADGSISGVKNIAYKPASGGNIADAYCTALYAARSGN